MAGNNDILIADRSRGIAYITYDVNGNPQNIYFTNGNETRYVYSATGQKLRVVHYTAAPNITRTFGVQPAELTQAQVLYKDSTDYLLGGSLVLKNGRTDKVLFDGGYAQATYVNSTSDSFSFRYYNKDHLGNNREVESMRGSVYQVTNYYPFGAPFVESTSYFTPDYQPYKYNGKELDLMHGLNTYDYGARQYDPILARWDRMDPLCEKYYSISPYTYCGNNPVNALDFYGDTITVINKGGLFLFSLDDGKENNISCSASDLYKNGIQWFAPTADNYMPLLYMNKYISVIDGIKHFSWDDIVSFSEIDRSSFSYRTGGSGDWKASGNPGDGFLLATVNGYPYWTDAIGQIPFALNCYRDCLRFFDNHEYAALETIRLGKKFGSGSILQGIFGIADSSNSYDNEMIKRAVDWAKKRYKIVGHDKWNRNAIIGKSNYSPNELSKPLR